MLEKYKNVKLARYTSKNYDILNKKKLKVYEAETSGRPKMVLPVNLFLRIKQ